MIAGKDVKFPKYTTQILNLANQNTQGTRPEVVGQMSELIKKTPNRTFGGWRKWYLNKHPDAIDKATAKIKAMLSSMKEAMDKIDEKMIRDWVEDLVLLKTAQGLIVQEIILRTLAKLHSKKYRLSTPGEEAKGVDGYIGEIPVSIKPESFLSKKPSVRDKIDARIIYYKKTSKYIYIYSDDLLLEKGR